MDIKFGGKDFACTSKYKMRAKNDPRYVDRRMQGLLRALQKDLDNFSMDQLCNIYYCTVKLRIPNDQIINKLVDIITICMSDPTISKELSMKNLALITWASARIKMPKECELPVKLELKA